jgi:hypothetical protein
MFATPCPRRLLATCIAAACSHNASIGAFLTATKASDRKRRVSARSMDRVA